MEENLRDYELFAALQKAKKRKRVRRVVTVLVIVGIIAGILAGVVAHFRQDPRDNEIGRAHV